LGRHAGSEPVVPAADGIEVGSSGCHDKETVVLADDAEQSLAEVGVRLGIADASPKESTGSKGAECEHPSAQNHPGGIVEAGIVENSYGDQCCDEDAQSKPKHRHPHFR
jgi:hypothetical protein